MSIRIANGRKRRPTDVTATKRVHDVRFGSDPTENTFFHAEASGNYWLAIAIEDRTLTIKGQLLAFENWNIPMARLALSASINNNLISIKFKTIGQRKESTLHEPHNIIRVNYRSWEAIDDVGPLASWTLTLPTRSSIASEISSSMVHDVNAIFTAVNGKQISG